MPVNILYSQEYGGLTDWEWQVVNELEDRLDALGDWPDWEDTDRVVMEVANKYRLTKDELYDLDEIAFYLRIYLVLL